DPSLTPNCSVAGVLGPLAGVMGSMVAVEVMKDVTLAGRTLRDRMLVYNALDGEARTFSLAKRQDCPACGRPIPAGGV
ncbi:MAG: molybdopterin biosynthesis protein, partial [Pseudomonadota bacterium]